MQLKVSEVKEQHQWKVEPLRKKEEEKELRFVNNCISKNTKKMVTNKIPYLNIEKGFSNLSMYSPWYFV